MTTVERSTSPDAATPLGELARLFLKLGTLAFGGPAAHIAMMEDEVVRRRGWLTREAFLDYLGATNLIPGPNSTELAIHIGHARAGWRGLIVAGACFILPAAAIVTAIAWAYVRFGTLPQAQAILYGVKPVVIAVVLQALWRLGRAAVKSATLAALGAVAVAATALGVGELVVLFAAAAAMAIVHAAARLRARAGAGGPPTDDLYGAAVVIHGGAGGAAAAGTANAVGSAGAVGTSSTAAASVAAGAAGTVAAGAAAAAAAPVSLWALFAVFAKIGAVLFGSGYVLLAFLRTDLVQRLGWLTERQLLDAVAVGQVTPGPVFTTATFVGFLTAGWAGAVVATVGIFLPAFVFVALSGPLIPRLRRSPVAGAALDGLNVASLALMVVVTWALARAALPDLATVALGLVSLLLLLRWRVNSAWLVVGGALAGLVLAR